MKASLGPIGSAARIDRPQVSYVQTEAAELPAAEDSAKGGTEAVGLVREETL